MTPFDPPRCRLVLSMLSPAWGSTAAVTGHHPLAPRATKPSPARLTTRFERLKPAAASAAPAITDAHRAVAEILGLYIDVIDGSVSDAPTSVRGFFAVNAA